MPFFLLVQEVCVLGFRRNFSASQRGARTVRSGEGALQISGAPEAGVKLFRRAVRTPSRALARTTRRIVYLVGATASTNLRSTIRKPCNQLML